MRAIVVSLVVLLLTLAACAAIYGPCTIDRDIGRAWCDKDGSMVLVPGSTVLDVRIGGASSATTPKEKR